MKNPVSILSFGISCPGGTSPEALEDFSKWPMESVPEAGGRGLREVSRINISAEPVNRWRMKPRLRRASPLSHHLIEAIAQTLEARPEIDPARVGVVGAFFFGCLEYSVRFYKGLSTDGRRFASPILFPETVVNTPLSHVVAELRIGGPVYSQVGDTSCWVSALRTACLWIENGDIDHVIVAGAEEFEAHLLDAFHSLRWFTKRHTLRVTEGAGAILIGRQTPSAIADITRIADGHTFRTRPQARTTGAECLASFDPSIPVFETATGWIAETASSLLTNRQKITLIHGPRREGFTASSAWNIILAAQQQEHARVVVPHWGLSQNIAAVEISRE
ncbi:MAG: beta-ketoacyl synthase N-terminal-like domain-containing protein [Spartobacteria bacterium]